MDLCTGSASRAAGPALLRARDSHHPDFPSGAQALELLARYRITNTLFLPADLALMQEAASGSFQHALRAVMVAGDTLPANLSVWTEQSLGVPPNEVYGLTEAPGIL